MCAHLLYHPLAPNLTNHCNTPKSNGTILPLAPSSISHVNCVILTFQESKEPLIVERERNNSGSSSSSSSDSGSSSQQASSGGSSWEKVDNNDA